MTDTPKKKPWKEMTSAEKRERSAFLKEERAARRAKLENTWKAQVAANFSYLETDYGFHFAGVQAENWWGTYVYYDSPLVRVEIDRSVEFGGIELELIRLEHGLVPMNLYASWDDNAVVNHLYFGQLLRERAPEQWEELRQYEGLENEQLARALPHFAMALRVVCDDILRGDLTRFDLATEERRQRIAERDRQIEEKKRQLEQPE